MMENRRAESSDRPVYTEKELTEICQTVFLLSVILEDHQIQYGLNEPEGELFGCIMDWAQEFERGYNPKDGGDYRHALESFALPRIVETLRLKEGSTPLQAIKDFVEFEDATAVVWPWARSAEEILASEMTLSGIAATLHRDIEYGYDSDEIYDALDDAFGVNPQLKQEQDAQPCMEMRLGGG